MNFPWFSNCFPLAFPHSWWIVSLIFYGGHRRPSCSCSSCPCEKNSLFFVCTCFCCSYWLVCLRCYRHRVCPCCCCLLSFLCVWFLSCFSDSNNQQKTINISKTACSSTTTVLVVYHTIPMKLNKTPVGYDTTILLNHYYLYAYIYIYRAVPAYCHTSILAGAWCAAGSWFRNFCGRNLSNMAREVVGFQGSVFGCIFRPRFWGRPDWRAQQRFLFLGPQCGPQFRAKSKALNALLGWLFEFFLPSLWQQWSGAVNFFSRGATGFLPGHWKSVNSQSVQDLNQPVLALPRPQLQASITQQEQRAPWKTCSRIPPARIL